MEPGDLEPPIGPMLVIDLDERGVIRLRDENGVALMGVARIEMATGPMMVNDWLPLPRLRLHLSSGVARAGRHAVTMTLPLFVEVVDWEPRAAPAETAAQRKPATVPPPRRARRRFGQDAPAPADTNPPDPKE